ncbi:MAG: 50S ribosomal protein L35 [SAR324 cluster bacterium]|uniref:Large ribosomal subunit protein bL35 n=1 Tax=SAR324 cluster bacterium TaxID=2024889 RepID=A0A7X9IJE5_9DELT|nr:50S ribosomal protein L35 [SAR324 cluster bacterium]
MPKIKTNRMAAKKFCIGGKGTVKRGTARGNHNTGKKSAKQCRRYRKYPVVDKANAKNIDRMLPYK